MRVQWKTHDNKIITTSNQTTLDSLKFDIMAISLGIMPVKLLLEKDNRAVEWIWQASMRVQWNTHNNTIITTSNQTTLDSHKFDSNAISVGIVPIKLLLPRCNESVEWRMMSKHWNKMKNNMTTKSLQQATKQHSTHINLTSRQSDLESCPSNHCRWDASQL
jgi:hypothetical protein